jgi:hypothetical protein
MSDKYTIDEWNKLGGHKVSCLPGWCFKTSRPVKDAKTAKTKTES